MVVASFLAFFIILSSFLHLHSLQSVVYPQSYNYPSYYYNYFHHSPYYNHHQYFPPNHPYHLRTISNNHYPPSGFREQIVSEYIRRNPSSSSRSIRPLACNGPDGTTGICMFSLACRHANGRPIGLCKDNIYAGSCCRLSDKSSLSVLDPILGGVSVVPEIENFVEYPTGVQENKTVSSPFKTSSPSTSATSSMSIAVTTQKIASPRPSSSTAPPTTLASSSASSMLQQEVTSNSVEKKPDPDVSSETRPFEASSSSYYTTQSTSLTEKETAATLNDKSQTNAKVEVTSINPIMNNSIINSTPLTTTVRTEATTQSISRISSQTASSQSETIYQTNEKLSSIPSNISSNELTKMPTLSSSSSFTSSSSLPTTTFQATRVPLPISSPFSSSFSTVKTQSTTTSPFLSSVKLSSTTTGPTSSLFASSSSYPRPSSFSTPSTVTSSSSPHHLTTANKISSSLSTVAPKNESNFSGTRAVCGRKMNTFFRRFTARIVGGSQSSFSEWPWMVSTRQWKKNAFLHKCGAALLNEYWAITAAHCVENVAPTDLLLRLGEYDISNEDEPYGHVERRVQIIAPHPKFDPRTFEYDLALLRFYEPVPFRKNIAPVCIPEGNKTYVGRTATVTGWGRLYEDGPLPNTLQHVSVPVITNDECEKMYRRAGYAEDIPYIFICAGMPQGGRDSCEGDSGGPLVIEENGRWHLIGIISWGIGCALPNQPGVYTRITEFRDWVSAIINY